MGDPRVEFTFEIKGGDYENTQVGFFTGVRSIIGKEEDWYSKVTKIKPISMSDDW